MYHLATMFILFVVSSDEPEETSGKLFMYLATYILFVSNLLCSYAYIKCIHH